MTGPPSPLNSRTDTGALTINGVDMHTPAWNVLDCTPLWLYVETRGQNIVLPGTSGTYAYPRRVHEARHSLQMAITGFVDSSGVPNADPWAGLQENIDYLRDNVAEPPTPPTSTVSASLVMPDGSTRTADIQVVAFTIGEHYHVATAAILDIVIPAGRFT